MSGFTDTFIKRPVFSSVLSLLILLVGTISYFKLPLRQFPMVPTPVINVSTTYTGASADLMETFITTPIESALTGVTGLDFMTSSNKPGMSSINVYLKLGSNVAEAASEINDKISAIKYKFPKGANDPVIAKQDPNADPILYISFMSHTMPMEELTDYLLRTIKPQLEAIDGVGMAKIMGEREYAMRVWMNPNRMAAHKITPGDVSNALANNNLQSPTGHLESKLQVSNISAATDLNTANQFNNLVVKTVDKNMVRVNEIGHAELGSRYTNFSVNVARQPAVFFGIIPKSNANPLEVAKLTRVVLEKLKPTYPKGVSARIVKDDSEFIDESIHEVKRTLVEACIFVILVIFLFLGSWRTLLIPAVTIPLSLLGVCALMLAAGFTLNTITFLAMVLAIGLVVDDAIVVVENIHRHIEKGRTPIAAAIIGAREIKFAVIAMTLTLAAVYAPIGFVGGLSGALFREFAFALAGAVIISGFIALTLSPMLCANFISSLALESRLEKWSNNFSHQLMQKYRYRLIQVLNNRKYVLIGLGVVLIACGILFKWIPNELAPKEDMGIVLVVAYAPASANVSYTEKFTDQFNEIFKNVTELESYGTVNGYPDGENSAISFLLLKPWDQRKQSADSIAFSLFYPLSQITGLRAFAFNPYQLPGQSGGFSPVEFVLKTTASYDELSQIAHKVLDKARSNPRLLNLDVDLKIDKPQTNILINRNKAGTLGVSMREISDALGASFAEPAVSSFSLRGRGYDVIPQLEREFRNKPESIKNIYVRSSNGNLIPLSNLVTLESEVAPRSLDHFQQLRSAVITASLAPGYSLGEALKYFNTIANEIMPKGMQVDYKGESRQFVQSSGAMTFTIMLAIVFIFLVLAAQFESFRDPLIVLFTVPLSTLGALLAIKLHGYSLNIYTNIALVTLVGLISKHGILIVEFANQLQLQGRSIDQAVIEAASLRLRPILMTTAAMVLGVIPLALSTGAGAVSRSQLGWAITGGLSIGTLFTLFVVPTVYTYLATTKKAFVTGDVEIDKTISEGT